MHGQLVAVLHRPAYLVYFREIEARRYTLGVKVERNIDEVKVARAFTVAEKTTFDAIGAGHQGKFPGRCARSPVVVRMNGQNNGIAPRQVPMHPLHHVGKDVGSGVLNRRRQVDDALVSGRGLPYLGHRIDDTPGKLKLGSRPHFRRILERPVRAGLLGSQLHEEARCPSRA